MQTQSRLAAGGGGCNSVSPDEHEAVVRELTRGHELTARLRAEALRALRGQGQSEKTAAFILQEVSRAFDVCLNIMRAPGRAPPPAPPPQMAAGARRGRDDNAPRNETMTHSPHSDGYLWRKYGQKRIRNTNFPRCYYRCNQQRNCMASKQVQQCSNGDPPLYAVVYVNEHTCNTPAPSVLEPPAAGGAPDALDLSGLMRRHGAGGALDERGVKEEHALVSSLACVLRGQSPPGGGGAAVAPERQGGRATAAPTVDARDALPQLEVELDVMDYDMTGALSFGDSYGLPDEGFPF
ncbi:hypothetical protein ACP70R_038569 [Stipagrostis hirtigluma subsp. patula]